MTVPEELEGLTAAVQYRRKDGAGPWRTMAAFDVLGPAEWYYGLQQKDQATSPWDYRLIDLSVSDGENETKEEKR